MSTGPLVFDVPRILDGERLDRVVSTICAVTRRQAAELVASGKVRVGGRHVLTRSQRLVEGDVIEVELPVPAHESPLEADAGMEVPVVHVDEQFVVVDKPAGVAVHPGAGRSSGTLVQGLLARFPDLADTGDPARPGIVHRLDIGTSGLMVVARTPLAYTSLVGQLSARLVDRRYSVLAWGRFESEAGMIDAPVGRDPRHRTHMAVSAEGRAARTRYHVEEQFSTPADAALLVCRLETGRTHQVRVHLAAIGHPVVGDTRYGGARPAIPLDRPFLHASHLAFDHPLTGERAHFSAPLPLELQQVRAALR